MVRHISVSPKQQINFVTPTRRRKQTTLLPQNYWGDLFPWTIKEPSTPKVLSPKSEWNQRTRQLRRFLLVMPNAHDAWCRHFWIIRNWSGLETTLAATQSMQTDHGWFLAACQTCGIEFDLEWVHYPGTIFSPWDLDVNVLNTTNMRRLR